MVGDSPGTQVARDGQPAVTSLDSQVVCDSARVQGAFSLGWHVTELYHFDKLRRDVDLRSHPSAPTTPKNPGQPMDALPGIGSLPDGERRAILVRQIRRDITQVWVQTLDGPDLRKLDEQVVALQGIPHVDEFCRAVVALHKTLLSGLTVADFRLGKSYGLARTLAESTILPCAVATSERLNPSAAARGPAEQDSPTGHQRGATRTLFEESLWQQLDSGRVTQVQGWLYDLRDCFPTHAADAVATTLAGWAVWMIRPTNRAGRPVEWRKDEDRDPIERALRRQGDVWRGLLSGEKDPVGMLNSDYYFAAIRSLLARISRLALRFLGTGVGFVLFLIVLVAGIGLYASSTTRNGTSVLPAVITFLGSLGITTGTAWAAVQKALSKAEQPLWSAELAAAIAHATWHNPAPLGAIDEIQLLLIVGSTPNPEAETRARHPRLTALRNLPVGRVGVALIVAGSAVGLFGAGAGWMQRDASFFLAPLIIVAFLAAIDGWDLLIGFASRQRAPYLALPERISLPDWAGPLAEVLAPALLLAGLIAGHYFWH